MTNPRYQTWDAAVRALRPGWYIVGPVAGFYSLHPATVEAKIEAIIAASAA